MPTYEYLCPTCSHRFEIWQKMTDDSLSVCSECGGHIRRVLYASGIVFKGSGFYKTDHIAKSPVSSNGHAAKGEGEGEGKTTEEKTSSESKPTESKSAESNAGDSGKSKSDSKVSPSVEAK